MDLSALSAAERWNLLLTLSRDQQGFRDPRRYDLIKWYLDHEPGNALCRSGYTHVDPEAAPEIYQEIKVKWLDIVAEGPPDADLSRSAAEFIALSDRNEAAHLIRRAIEQHPNDAGLWADLGRMSSNPKERLEGFERGRRLGWRHANIDVWIAQAALELGDHEKARTEAEKMLIWVAEARSEYGHRLDITARGKEFWERVRTVSSSDDDAKTLSKTISDSAYRKHHAYTILGLLACAAENIDEAVSHLFASADIRPDFRLETYGPSFPLLREICRRDRWDDGLQFLQMCKERWGDSPIDEWMAAVRGHRLPGEPA